MMAVLLPKSWILLSSSVDKPPFRQIFYILIIMQKDTYSIYLRNKKLGNTEMASIYEGKTNNIKQLSLQNNMVTEKGMQKFPKNKWGKLVYMSIYGNRIGDRGCKYLSTARLNSIIELNLGANNIGSVGVTHLSKASWQSLSKIWLYCNLIGLGSICRLIRSNWTNISELLLTNNGVMKARMNLVTANCSNCEFKSLRVLRISQNSNTERKKDQLGMMIDCKLGYIKLSL